MSQAITKKNLTSASLRGRQSARTVLARMASDQERAERVRELKDSRPDLTWGRIAEAVGVRERSAIEWQKTGGMDYGNAKKLAKLFDVSAEWLWSGIDRSGDSIPVTVTAETQLDRIELALDAIRTRLDALDADAIERDELTAALLAALRDAKTAGSAPARRRRAS